MFRSSSRRSRPAELFALVLVLSGAVAGSRAAAQGFQSSDLSRLRAVGSVEISPDGRKVAYTIMLRDRPGRPYTQVSVMDLATQQSVRFGAADEGSGNPVWSPDGKWLAYIGGAGDHSGLWIAQPDGSGATFLAPMQGTNSPILETGASVTWSPDGHQIAFVSATPGPETAAADADPKVITRYLYKPTYTEGNTEFNDNRRLHIFIVSVADHQVRQLTNGTHDEHSIDWSPDGSQILFAADYEPNQDEFFRYDLFAVRPTDGHIRRLTTFEGCVYSPKWSPDGKWIAYTGTVRGLTDRESAMEDPHIWLIDGKGEHRHQIGGGMDLREGVPHWSPEGTDVWFTVEQRGSVHLARIPVAPGGAGGPEQIVVNDVGNLSSFSIGRRGAMAYALATPLDMAELYVKNGPAAAKQVTNVNADFFKGKEIAKVDSFTFVSNDGKFTVEGFLVQPLGLVVDKSDTFPTKKYPLVLDIHGGPHGQQGPAFSFQDQVYAAHGFVSLHVNYRGSTGYGQKFADGIFGDLDGEEGQDVMYGVSAAVHQNLWIDRDRMSLEGVSYGGELTDWIITQTNEFKAAVPTASISNLVSQNYLMFANVWEESEYGQLLTQGELMDRAWHHSALRYVGNVHTPVMFIHGEHDNDVPIADPEQYYVALKDVGVETIMVRYPREGHGLRETKHVIDWIDRKMAWYDDHFARVRPGTVTNIQP
jgi:dipeptidyl aminopeptidase/acylaminoacyl peptidase